jgi:hypothetical protein
MFIVYCSSYHILFFIVFPKGCAFSGKVILVSETLLLVLDLAPELCQITVINLAPEQGRRTRRTSPATTAAPLDLFCCFENFIEDGHYCSFSCPVAAGA